MFKVLTFLGTRPEIIKLSEVIKKMNIFFDHKVVHTGQHYDHALSSIFFSDLGLLEPDHYLEASTESPIRCIADVLVRADMILEQEQPDAILLYGDTNSTLAAYAAKRRQIPIFHMEAGNRCYDFRVPEEVNRRVVDHLSDVNMVISEQARDNLIREGKDAQFVFKVGSSMPEVILRHSPAHEHFKDAKLRELMADLNIEDDDPSILLVSIHREENVSRDDYVSSLLTLLRNSKLYAEHTVVSAHPRLRKLISEQLQSEEYAHVKLCIPFSFTEYILLQKTAVCTISDSGSLMEEASILNFPAVQIRDSHERPEAVEMGSVVFSSWDLRHIHDSVSMAITLHKYRLMTFDALRKVHDYEVGCEVSNKVVNIISSYITAINRKVYYK